jgi:hypothetical protein
MQTRGDNLDVTAFVTVKLHANGALSVSGNIGDAPFALSLLDHAKDAVRGQAEKRKRPEIIVPNRDVAARSSDAYPLRERAEMAPHERGDEP